MIGDWVVDLCPLQQLIICFPPCRSREPCKHPLYPLCSSSSSTAPFPLPPPALDSRHLPLFRPSDCRRRASSTVHPRLSGRQARSQHEAGSLLLCNLLFTPLSFSRSVSLPPASPLPIHELRLIGTIVLPICGSGSYPDFTIEMLVGRV